MRMQPCCGTCLPTLGALTSQCSPPTPTQVARLFSKIGELLEEPDSLVFVLIDEVESLAAARKVSESVRAALPVRGRADKAVSA
jgi:hypothetical protein